MKCMKEVRERSFRLFRMLNRGIKMLEILKV
jgi:hypothetical protein